MKPNKILITLFILVVCFLLPFKGYNQKADTLQQINKFPFLFAEFGVGYSNGSSGISGNLILRSMWGLNIGYNHINKNSNELPPDYLSGFCIWTCRDPTDIINSYSYRLSKVFNTRTKLIRFRLEAGLAFVQYKKVHFAPFVSSSWLNLSSNYSTSYSSFRTKGVSFRGVSEFPYSQVTGLQVAILATFTSYISYAEIEFNMTLGYVREKLKN